MDMSVEGRSLSGEITAHASPISEPCSEVEPDLVVWQVEISDALAQADVRPFRVRLVRFWPFFVLTASMLCWSSRRSQRLWRGMTISLKWSLRVTPALAKTRSCSSVALLLCAMWPSSRPPPGRAGLNFKIGVTIAPLSMSGWWCGFRWSASRGSNRGDRCGPALFRARQQASGVETRCT